MALGKETQMPSPSPDPFSCWKMQKRFYESGAVSKKNCAALWVHPKNFGSFYEKACASPKSSHPRGTGRQNRARGKHVRLAVGNAVRTSCPSVSNLPGYAGTEAYDATPHTYFARGSGRN